MNTFRTSFLLASIALFVSAASVHAQEQITSDSCLAPTGSVVADYADGVHGIAGLGSKTGHDTVYSTENGILQCLCATDGTGTQTNWISTSNLSDDQVKVYVSQGWIAIPDGTAWGLTDGSYLAKNVNYSCGGSTVNNGGGSSQGDGQSDGKSDGKSDGRSDGMGTSIVQAATGNSGLASTGNVVFVVSALLAGILTTAFGLWLRKNTK